MSKNSKGVSGEIKIPSSITEEITRNATNLPGLQEKIRNSLGEDISKVLEIILMGAISVDSSDIHIEPEEDKVKIRMRLDGVLHDISTIEKELYYKIVSRIKLLSRVKINIEDRPQDGRFTIWVPEEDLSIEIRMSTLPSEYGETIVMRLLDPRKLINLDQLGLRDDLYHLFKKEIEKPNGMIIVTGPTGSGKTTTLYAFLKTINKPDIKIVTIEDPVEYHLEGISQTRADPSKGYDFASGLRTIVRQDPDVILVGEIRDLETGQISMQAALTGHLVFSTLHTNDASGAIARLQALGEKAVNIAPSINMIIAQRLVRKVCKSCTKLIEAKEEELNRIKEELKDIKEDVFSIPDTVKLPQNKGCRECGYTGYRGRAGIFEALIIDEEVEELILSSPSTSKIKNRAIEKGMITMRQDGVIKVLRGETTMEEINRVT